MVDFARLVLPQDSERLDKLDRLRRRRHRTVYDVAGQVSTVEAEEAIALATELLPVLKRTAEQKVRP